MSPYNTGIALCDVRMAGPTHKALVVDSKRYLDDENHGGRAVTNENNIVCVALLDMGRVGTLQNIPFETGDNTR